MLLPPLLLTPYDQEVMLVLAYKCKRSVYQQQPLSVCLPTLEHGRVEYRTRLILKGGQRRKGDKKKERKKAVRIAKPAKSCLAREIKVERQKIRRRNIQQGFLST